MKYCEEECGVAGRKSCHSSYVTPEVDFLMYILLLSEHYDQVYPKYILSYLDHYNLHRQGSVKYERITCPSFVNPPALTARAHFRREKNSDISNSEIYFLS